LPAAFQPLRLKFQYFHPLSSCVQFPLRNNCGRRFVLLLYRIGAVWTGIIKQEQVSSVKLCYFWLVHAMLTRVSIRYTESSSWHLRAAWWYVPLYHSKLSWLQCARVSRQNSLALPMLSRRFYHQMYLIKKRLPVGNR
jgi:hypothetical protein